MIPDMLEIYGNILLDVTKQLKLKFNALFGKPRRPNFHRFGLRFLAPGRLENTDPRCMDPPTDPSL